jgi:hypothetical protein
LFLRIVVPAPVFDRPSLDGGAIPAAPLVTPSPPALAERRQIDQLRDAKRQVLRILESKRAAGGVRVGPSPARRGRVVAPPPPSRVTTTQLTPLQLPLQDPWTLQLADFARHVPLKALLDSFHISVDGAFGGDVLEGIDTELTRLVSEVDALEHAAEETAATAVARHLHTKFV